MTDSASFMRRLGIRVMEKARKTDALSLLPALEKSQWLTGEDLEKEQVLQLRRHLEYCGREVPYYRDLFEGLGFDPAGVRSLRDLAALPLLDKEAIKEAGERLLPAQYKALGPRPKQTSGSTGIPLNYFLDFHSHSYLWAHIWRAWGMTGYRPGDYYATLSGGSLLPEKVDFKQKVYLYLSGCLHFPSYHLTAEIMERYARTLKKNRVRFIYGYPSSLELFARHLLDAGHTGLQLSAVFTTSELLAPEVRELLETAFGCRVQDVYGCNDGGLYSFECDRHQGFHQAMESCIVEVVDDAGQLLPDGTPGRIVTTHFANKCHPFLRYITGDSGAIDRTDCPCGRGLLRIVNLQGRERDVVLTPDGRKIHGAFFNHFHPFYEATWLKRYQIHQTAVDALEVWMITDREPTAGEAEHIRQEMRRGLGDMQINLKTVDELELTRTGKFRVVVSHLS